MAWKEITSRDWYTERTNIFVGVCQGHNFGLNIGGGGVHWLILITGGVTTS